MNWNVNKMYTMYTIRQSFLHKYTYLINLSTSKHTHKSITPMRTHLPSPKTTFTQLPENNIYVKLWTNWSNSTCTSMFCRSDKCRRPASSLADISTLVIQSIFILKYHIHACTFSIHVPVCSPIKCYLKCQSNGHLYNFTTFINENKIHFSDTVKVNKKS